MPQSHGEIESHLPCSLTLYAAVAAQHAIALVLQDMGFSLFD